VPISARNRVQSFAVWGVGVFVLNVVAFLLMGMQARQIVAEMSAERLREAAGFAGLVVLGVIVTRMAWSLCYNLLVRALPVIRGDLPPPSFAQSVLVGWCGMRGLVTLATAFALPQDFPQRDLIVLSAFAVVLATLVLQGLTLAPLIKLLGLAGKGDGEALLDQARRKLAEAALAALEGEQGKIAEETRRQFEIDRNGADNICPEFDARQRLRLAAVAAQRDKLDELRDSDVIGQDLYEQLQEELDWRDRAISPAGRRLIEAG
jgi:CPA1 family monovalent cation:H+ antiporter